MLTACAPPALGFQQLFCKPPATTQNSNTGLTLCSSSNGGGKLRFPNDIAFAGGNAIITSACGWGKKLSCYGEGGLGLREGDRLHARGARPRRRRPLFLFLALLLTHTHNAALLCALSTLLPLPPSLDTQTLSLPLSGSRTHTTYNTQHPPTAAAHALLGSPQTATGPSRSSRGEERE